MNVGNLLEDKMTFSLFKVEESLDIDVVWSKWSSS